MNMLMNEIIITDAHVIHLFDEEGWAHQKRLGSLDTFGICIRLLMLVLFGADSFEAET